MWGSCSGGSDFSGAAGWDFSRKWDCDRCDPVLSLEFHESPVPSERLLSPFSGHNVCRSARRTREHVALSAESDVSESQSPVDDRLSSLSTL